MAVALSRSWLAHATLPLISSLRYVPHRKACRYKFTSWYQAVRITLNSNNDIILLIKSEGSFISRVTHKTPTTRLLPPIPAPKPSDLCLPSFTTSGVITTDVRVVSFDKCIFNKIQRSGTVFSQDISYGNSCEITFIIKSQAKIRGNAFISSYLTSQIWLKDLSFL